MAEINFFGKIKAEFRDLGLIDEYPSFGTQIRGLEVSEIQMKSIEVLLEPELIPRTSEMAVYF